MKPELHPWLSTPEALKAAQKAVQIPAALMPRAAQAIGADELYGEALVILTECALPLRTPVRALCAQCDGPLTLVRAGAKFCGVKCRDQHKKDVKRSAGKTRRRDGGAIASTVPDGPSAHIGSMWTWPKDKRAEYAVRVVGYALNNYLRTQRHARPSSDAIANMALMAQEPEETPTEVMADYLSRFRGVKVTGDESFEDLYEAAVNLGVAA